MNMDRLVVSTALAYLALLSFSASTADGLLTTDCLCRTPGRCSRRSVVCSVAQAHTGVLLGA